MLHCAFFSQNEIYLLCSNLTKNTISFSSVLDLFCFLKGRNYQYLQLLSIYSSEKLHVIIKIETILSRIN